MPDLKLPKLPDRTPVKIVISVAPDLHEQLKAYGAMYADAYGHDEPLSELIPAMLAAFLNGDRAFQRRRAQTRARTE